MIVLGIILLVVGFVAAIPILWTIGIILLVVGAIFAILGATGALSAVGSTGTDVGGIRRGSALRLLRSLGLALPFSVPASVRLGGGH